MNVQPPATAVAATLSGAAAMIAVAPVSDIGFILQAVGAGGREREVPVPLGRGPTPPRIPQGQPGSQQRSMP
jgi:hypothetical protein